MEASCHPEEVWLKKGLTGDDHAIVLIGINVGFLTTSSYVDPVGFFRGGIFFCSRNISRRWALTTLWDSSPAFWWGEKLSNILSTLRKLLKLYLNILTKLIVLIRLALHPNRASGRWWCSHRSTNFRHLAEQNQVGPLYRRALLKVISIANLWVYLGFDQCCFLGSERRKRCLSQVTYWWFLVIAVCLLQAGIPGNLQR